MKTLLVADIHVDESSDAEYRWEIFNFLRTCIKSHEIERLIFLGDLTEKKDNHSSKLLNRLVGEICRLGQEVDVFIFPGNHDYSSDASMPFFRFLQVLENSKIFVNYISKPSVIETAEGIECFLPHTHSPKEDWSSINFSKVDRVFMHQCVSGARFSNNFQTERGVVIQDIIPDSVKIYSGDIHVPQQIRSNFVYVGAPYSVDFGDHYRGRVLLIESGKPDISLFPDFLIKWSLTIKNVEDLKKYSLKFGDRVCVSIELAPRDYHLWRQKKEDILKYLQSVDVQVRNVSMKTEKTMRASGSSRPSLVPDYCKVQKKAPLDWVKYYAGKEKLSENYLEIGLSLI